MSSYLSRTLRGAVVVMALLTWGQSLWADGFPTQLVQLPGSIVYPPPGTGVPLTVQSLTLTPHPTQMYFRLRQGVVGAPTGSGYTFTSFFDVFTEISTDGGTTYTPVTTSTTATIQASNLFTEASGVQGFDTEMVSLNLSGGTLPGGIMIRESPTKASLGTVTATDNGSGQYIINSFFDIFTELSLDGGATWTPAAGQGATFQGSAVEASGVPLPTIPAGMAALGSVLMLLRRRGAR